MPIEKLTAQFVLLAYCQEGKSKVDYYDTTVTGFTLEVRPSGGKTYWLRYVTDTAPSASSALVMPPICRSIKPERRRSGFAAELP